MRKIALITDGWKRFFIYAWPAGILQRIQETKEEINLYIFNSFGNWSRDQKYNSGEYNIFNLPDFKDFDGIILDLNNISSEKVLAEVVYRAKRSGKPVVWKISIMRALITGWLCARQSHICMKSMDAGSFGLLWDQRQITRVIAGQKP